MILFGIHKLLASTPYGVFEAKGDQEAANTATQQSRTQMGSLYQNQLNNLNQQGAGDTQQANDERNQLWGTDTNFAATGGDNPANDAALKQAGILQPNTVGGTSTGGGGSGGSNYGNPPGSQFNYVGPSAYTNNPSIDAPIADLANTNAQRYQDVNTQIQGLDQFGATGGLTSADMSALNRPNFYEFEQTGGYDASQLADIRARSNSTVPAFYQGLQDQMAQQRLKSGQYGGASFDASSAQAARQGAEQSADQTRNTEIDLANAVRQGRMSASQQLAANELGVIQYTTPAKEAALATATQGANQLASTENQGIYDSGQLAEAKAAGIDSYTINVANGKDKYATTEDQIAAQRAMASAGINAQMSIAQAQLNSQNQRFIMSQQQQGQEYGMGALGSLYGEANGPETQNDAATLALLNGYSSDQNQNLGIQANLSGQPGSTAQGFNNLFNGMNALGGGIPGLGGTNSFSSNQMDPSSQYTDPNNSNVPGSPSYTPSGPSLPGPGDPGYVNTGPTPGQDPNTGYDPTNPNNGYDPGNSGDMSYNTNTGSGAVIDPNTGQLVYPGGSSVFTPSMGAQTQNRFQYTSPSYGNWA